VVFEYLMPWQFSSWFVVVWLVVFVLYTINLLQDYSSAKNVFFYGRIVCFYSGWLSIYLVWHTYFDYLSQYMFWVHRLQHLVLHHIAPLLIVLGVIDRVADKESGYRAAWQLVPRFIRLLCGKGYGFLQNAFVAPLLFVGLIYLWLWPSIHFSAMLNQNLYILMNLTMLLDGLLFWWLLLGRSWQGEKDGFMVRVIMLVAVLIPQQLLGAYITFSQSVIFDVYDVCGRAWPISSLADQRYGGLITWIPASMMSVVGFLLVLRRRLNYQKKVSL